MTEPVPRPVRRDPRHRNAVRRVAGDSSASVEHAKSIEWTELHSIRCLVVVDVPSGKLSLADRVILGAARALANTDEFVALMAFGELTDDAYQAGADCVVTLPGLCGFRPDGRLAAIDAAFEAYRVSTVLFVEQGDMADLGRRFAASRSASIACDVVAIEGESVVCQPDESAQEWLMPAQPVMLLTITAGTPFAGQRRTPLLLPPLLLPNVRETGLTAVDTVAADPDRVPLAEARLILSAGAGVTDWMLYHQLSRLLRATRAGSRVVCDEGHLPRDRQVGASGTLVHAQCYVALGISGAPQHLAGIAACDYVIAVNHDPRAPIFERADLGFVADVTSMMRALVAEIDVDGS